MTPYLHRIRVLTAFAMPPVFFIGIDEAGHGTHIALRFMGVFVSFLALVIFYDVWRSYHDGGDDDEEDTE